MAGSRRLLGISRYMYKWYLDIFLVSSLCLAIAFQWGISGSPLKSLDHLHPTFHESEGSNNDQHVWQQIVKLLSHMIGGCSWVVFSKTWSFKTQKRTNLHSDAVSLTMYFLSYCTHIYQSSCNFRLGSENHVEIPYLHGHTIQLENLVVSQIFKLLLPYYQSMQIHSECLC